MHRGGCNSHGREQTSGQISAGGQQISWIVYGLIRPRPRIAAYIAGNTTIVMGLQCNSQQN